MAESYKSIELPDSVPGIGYTIKHRNAVAKLIEYYCKKAIGKRDTNGDIFTQQDYRIMLNRAKCHDMDKLIVSLSYPQLVSDYFHRLFNGHHEESIIEPSEKSKYDWIEMIMDMESAKYTKADKQGGGAYAYASKCKTYIMNYLLPYFKLFNLDTENPGIIQSIKQEVNRKYYESDLIDSILNYIHTTHIHLLDGLSRIDDKGYMAKYNSPVPYRHPSTQCIGGTDHVRPAPICSVSQGIMSREFIHGNFEASIYDMDKICLLRNDDIKSINRKALSVLKDMGSDYQR